LPNRYYGSFAPGLQGFIAEVLGERLPGLKIVKLLEGAVIFDTAAGYAGLNLFCFNNIFQVIDMRSCGEAADRESWIGAALARGRGSRVIGENSRKIRSFRVIFSRENVPAPLDGKLRNLAETCIARESGLAVNRSSPDTEFWFLYRRDGGGSREGPAQAAGTGPGLGLFMKRLTRHPSFDKSLHPGELPPPLAWALCRLSGPKAGERVADPFCGYGSIPQARLRYFPPAEFFASDTDGGALARARGKFGKPPPRCHFNRIDAAELSRIIPPASLDAIITDPPWGFHEKLPCPLEEFYARFLAVFAGLLKKGGSGVFLCGRGEEFKTAAERKGFTVDRTLPILLSGKKALIYVLRI
jgi:predicted RNA methylase